MFSRLDLTLVDSDSEQHTAGTASYSSALYMYGLRNKRFLKQLYFGGPCCNTGAVYI